MKILVDAFLDKNFGDDVMVQMLAHKFKDHELYINCKDKVLMIPFEHCANIHMFNFSKKYLERRHQIKQFDAYIRIGGSIFIIKNLLSAILRLRRLPLLLALKKNGTKSLIIGCNIGPFGSKMGELVARLEVAFANIITVRDIESYSFICRKNVSRRFYFPDILLSYPSDSLPKTKGEGYLGISAYRSIHNQGLNYFNYKKMAEIADEYIEQKTGNKVLLFAFDSENENDIAAAYNILNNVKHEDFIEIIVYNGNTTEFINNLSRCSFLVTVRFHSAIMAMKMGIPFLPVIYSNKMNNCLNDMHYSGERLYLKEISSVDAKQVVSNIVNLNNIYCDKLEQSVVEDAAGHLMTAHTFLNMSVKTAPTEN